MPLPHSMMAPLVEVVLVLSEVVVPWLVLLSLEVMTLSEETAASPSATLFWAVVEMASAVDVALPSFHQQHSEDVAAHWKHGACSQHSSPAFLS